MKYDIQTAIEKLQKYKKKYPENKLVGEDDFLLLCRDKVNNIDQVVRRLKNEVERTGIEEDDYKKGKRNDFTSHYQTINETAKLLIIAKKTLYDWIKNGLFCFAQK